MSREEYELCSLDVEVWSNEQLEIDEENPDWAVCSMTKQWIDWCEKEARTLCFCGPVPSDTFAFPLN